MPNPFKNPNNEVTPKHKDEEATIAAEETVVETPKRKNNLLVGLIDEKPEAKAYSLYLDVDVVEEIDRLAAGSKGLNRSKIANALLRKVLFRE